MYKNQIVTFFSFFAFLRFYYQIHNIVQTYLHIIW